MTRTRPLPLLGFGLALAALYGLAVFVAGRVPRLEQSAVVAAALTLDLVVTAPLLYYALLVRRRRWPALSVAPIFLLSLLAASFVVPADHQALLRVLQYLAAPVELLLLGYVGVTVARTARRFRSLDAGDDADFFDRLRASLRQTLGAGWAADVIACEVGVFYYALFSWRTPPNAAARPDAFSYHRRSGYGTVVAGILVAVVLEMIALHLLLRLWNPALAWVLTALSIYGILWLLGDVQAARLRPIHVEKDALRIRIGLRWTVRVPFEAIARVLPAGKTPPPRKTPGYLEAVLLGQPSYLFELKQPVVAQGLYGMRKTVSALGLAPDDAASFETVLKQRFADWQQGRA